ncbi:hypothetical protein IWQ56_001832, partial [Coemansia nantahalensis]
MFKGAVLFKNGYQTSCEIVPVTRALGFIAANCFDYTSGTTLDPATAYAVFLDDDASGTVVLQFALEFADIAIHPNYDPDTFANNIAVIKFNMANPGDWSSYISLNPDAAGVDTYVRRTLGNVDNRWNAIQVHEQDADSAECSAGSGIYNSNPGWMACTTSNVQSVNRTSCSVPYGTKYSSYDRLSMPSGLYSHSVIYGSDSCSGKARWLNYYTHLWPYVGFFYSSTGRYVAMYNGTDTSFWDTGVVHSMKNESPPPLAETTTMGGDFYA